MIPTKSQKKHPRSSINVVESDKRRPRFHTWPQRLNSQAVHKDTLNAFRFGDLSALSSVNELMHNMFSSRAEYYERNHHQSDLTVTSSPVEKAGYIMTSGEDCGSDDRLDNFHLATNRKLRAFEKEGMMEISLIDGIIRADKNDSGHRLHDKGDSIMLDPSYSEWNMHTLEKSMSEITF